MYVWGQCGTTAAQHRVWPLLYNSHIASRTFGIVANRSWYAICAISSFSRRAIGTLTVLTTQMLVAPL